MAAFDHIVIGASDLGNTSRLKPDYAEMLDHPYPDESVFKTLLMKVNEVEKATQQTFTVQYEWPPDRELEVTAASAAAADVSVDDRSGIVGGMVFEVLNTDGSAMFQVRVQSTPSSGAGTLDITDSSNVRVYNDSGVDASIPKGAKLRLGANYRSENDTVPDAVMRAPGQETQYIPMFERKIAFTEVSELIDYYGIKEPIRIERQQMREFDRDREFNLKLAKAKADTATATTATAGGPRYIPDGVREHAYRWNRVDASGTVTFKTLIKAGQQTNRLGGPGPKYFLMSQNLYTDLAALPLNWDVARQDLAKKSIDLEIKSFSAPGVPEGHFVWDRDMDGRNEILIVDFRGLSLKRLQGISFKRNVQTPGTHRTENLVYVREALKVVCPWRQGLIVHADRIAA